MDCAASEYGEHAEHAENPADTCIDRNVSAHPRLANTFIWYMKILVVMKVIFWGVISYAYFSTPSRVVATRTTAAQTDGEGA